MMARSASAVAIEADPNDPEDFDVSEAAVAQALRERATRRSSGVRPAGLNKQPVAVQLDRDVVEPFQATDLAGSRGRT